MIVWIVLIKMHFVFEIHSRLCNPKYKNNTENTRFERKNVYNSCGGTTTM